MTVLVLAPDVEQLVVQFLLDQDELADQVDTDVYSALPKDHLESKAAHAVRVHQFDDAQASGPALWLMWSGLQIDVWGGSKKATRRIAETTRSLLVARLVGSHDEGVVTGVTVRGLNTTPDSDFTPPRPRCRFDVEVWAHPSPAVGS